MSLISKLPPRVSKLLLWLFVFHILPGGCILVGYEIHQMRLSWRIDEFQSVIGQVESHTINKRWQRKGHIKYLIKVSYRFVVDGQTYKNNKIMLGEDLYYRNQSDARAWLNEHISDDNQIEVFYLPSDPSVSLLDKSVTAGIYFGMILGFAFAVAGICLMVGLIRGTIISDAKSKKIQTYTPMYPR
ncbi:DUF3592 domain-containing protein [Planctomycetota bacterium]|nr:DUF3592 domain-containing protein [Planctomycetota bacterium]